jgi:glycosyltransferase involved in cell wall biosynthesis
VFVKVGGVLSRRACRILYVIGGLHTGGEERQLYYLVRSLDQDVYHPAVAVWNYGELDVHVPLIRALDLPLYAAERSSRIEKLTAFRRLVKQLAPEIVHSYSFYTNIAAAWATAGTGVLSIGSVRSDFDWAKREAGPLLGRLSARWPRFHICNSISASRSARNSRSFFAPTRCAFVANGLDLERFQPSPIPADGPARIVGIGYLLPVKRWDRLLRAASVLRRNGCDFTLDLVGGGPLKAVLKRQVEQLELNDRVRLMDHTDDIPRVLREASFTVLTSDREGYPNAVMEAMACGRAVVATDVGDIDQLVDDGTTGFLVPVNDESALVDRMAALITDRHRCARMGEAGRAKAECEFGLERLARQTLEAYRSAGWNERDGETSVRCRPRAEEARL